MEKNMNKRQVISSLNNIAEELDNIGLYVEASTIANVMKKVAQVQNEVPPQNQDDLLKQTYELMYEFNQKAPVTKVIKQYNASIRSSEPGFLTIFDPQNANDPGKKMTIQQVRQFMNNGFK
jgi:hypothetical protein